MLRVVYLVNKFVDNVIFLLICNVMNLIYFRVGATFEMIRTESDEMCISIDQDCGSTVPFIRREIKQGSGETERENVCACECWLKPKIASISIHKQHG